MKEELLLEDPEVYCPYSASGTVMVRPWALCTLRNMPMDPATPQLGYGHGGTEAALLSTPPSLALVLVHAGPE